MTEKNKWPAQREILKHGAYVSGFLNECGIIYGQILVCFSIRFFFELKTFNNSFKNTTNS